MSDTIRYLREDYRQHNLSSSEDSKKGGGGSEPPGGDKLEKRVENLEQSLKGIEISLGRIETALDGLRTNVFPNLATKADLANDMGAVNQSVANFRTDITRVEGSMIKWFITTAFLLSGGVGAAAFGLARALPH
ncbi:hypothetical protein [Pseudomonas sp. 25 E 4]|uniref:hypothetical protein n=1 Tax=Pseudomonas sp. 25 E 4 TaxID=1844097 RepID=UPI0008125323|nr:hypothetical protein [Pseudomonas sp. 25 E 4]CRM71185.1 hypothetical protein [Pseudomonas sp. 25 E 4]